MTANHVMKVQGKCHYCGVFGPFTRDHVIPRSRGGALVPNNIVYACTGCNLRKGAMTGDEYRTYLASAPGRLWLHQRGVHKIKSDPACGTCANRAIRNADKRAARAAWRRNKVPFNADVISAQGRRATMEDTHILSKIGDTLLGAIFDGHSGKAVADLGERRFATLWQEATGDNLDRMTEALTRLQEESRGLQGGACVVAFALRDHVLTVGNVGDAELAWTTKEYSVTVSEVHRLDSDGEVRRLLNSGAMIQLPYFYDSKTGRGLMPTRTIGDHEFTAVGLSSTPYVREMFLSTEGWIVAACDGLWDEIEVWELPTLLKDHPEPEHAVKYLMNEAITERNGTDNVSIIVVKFTPAGVSAEGYATTTISDTLVDERVA